MVDNKQNIAQTNLRNIFIELYIIFITFLILYDKVIE